jgi:hypothetical protein
MQKNKEGAFIQSHRASGIKHHLTPDTFLEARCNQGGAPGLDASVASNKSKVRALATAKSIFAGDDVLLGHWPRIRSIPES